MKRIIALTDRVNDCDCCGKTNLKQTYAVIDELGNEFYYGTTCVKNNLGYKKEDIQKDLNKSKQIAKNEYYLLKEEIKTRNLHPLEELRELKNTREKIADKYYLPIYCI